MMFMTREKLDELKDRYEKEVDANREGWLAPSASSIASIAREALNWLDLAVAKEEERLRDLGPQRSRSDWERIKEEPHALLYVMYQTEDRTMWPCVEGVYPNWAAAEEARSRGGRRPEGYVNRHLPAILMEGKLIYKGAK